jgi:cytochrome P450
MSPSGCLTLGAVTVASPLPAMAIADMSGIPLDDHERVQRWADDVIRFFDGTFGDE